MKSSQILCSDGVRAFALQGRWRGRIVVSRALCLYRRLAMGTVPRAQRPRALRLAIEEWTPFTAWAGAVVWGADAHASVWIWDDANARLRLDLAQSSPRAAEFLPESLLYAPRGSPVDCVRIAEGWLARRWRDGELLAEYRFSRPPSAAEWSQAMLAIGGEGPAAEAAFAAVTAVAGEPDVQPWDVRVERIGAAQAPHWLTAERVVASGAVALAAATVWFGAESLRQYRGGGSLREQLAATTVQAEPVQRARAQAFDAADRLRAWAQLDPFPSSLAMLNALAGSVPAGMVITDYRFEGGVIRATVTNPGAQMTGDFVSRLQDAGLFSSVRVVPSADPRSLQFEIEASSAVAGTVSRR